MTGPDDEFEDFLRRRKPVFRAPDDLFEPPAEIDRIVLRRAREAIESERPMRMFRGPRWAAPLALAATLVLAFTVLFQVESPPKRQPQAEVTVQNTAQRVDYPEAFAPAANAPAAEADERATGAAASSEAVVQLSKSARGEVAPSAPVPSAPGKEERYVAAPPATAPAYTSAAADSMTSERSAAGGAPAAAKASAVPDWRRDSKTWLAEIDRLRNAGDVARADAELEEYKRQHRALAVAPNR